MSQQKDSPQISWAQFEICNPNPQTAFENMCRVLFNSFFFDGKEVLHSDHNNPGIEVLPKLHQETGKRISFQAKYFTKLSYSQIKHSAQMAIKHYSGKLDTIYLYCNKSVTTTSNQYKDIVALLEAEGIEIITIANRTILEQAMQNTIVARYYFDAYNLDNEWFKERLNYSLSSLGLRYNSKFNVTTRSEHQLNLFLHNEKAIDQINQIKQDAITKIENNRWNHSKYSILTSKIINAISSLQDVTYATIFECLTWSDTLTKICAPEIAEIQNLIEIKKKAYTTAFENKEHKKASHLKLELLDLQALLDFPKHVSPNNHDSNILQKKVLIVTGDAGAGKSQLFANAAEAGLKSNTPSLLLLGHTFLNNDPITIQIPTQLQIDLHIDTILQKLEGLGYQLNRQICIFIDAINESGNKAIWKTGLLSLINKIAKLNYVRLAVSVRSGYEKLVFDDAVQSLLNNNDIARFVHSGFREESVEAAQAFMNYYGIPFMPSYFLQSEMTNPLFLKLFCDNYSGEEVDLFTLFDKVIKRADGEAQQAVELDGSTDLLRYLLNQIAEKRLDKGSLSISKEELYNLPFWNTYGLNSNQSKIPFILSLERSGLLISSAYNGEELYHIGYNLIEDFICAKVILRRNMEKSKLIDYLQNQLLGIKNGKITKYENQHIFIAVCNLFEEKYGEDCFRIITENINDKFERSNFADLYITSYRWRSIKSVNRNTFLDVVRQYKVSADVVFPVLIECSTKINHPLNADTLHNLLLPMSLTHRDYVWTLYINDRMFEEERLFQLIDYFDRGNNLDGLSATNIRLLLTLFTWLLTSSNRHMRDKASKASIELLKKNFSLCKLLLQQFESVNDPYVIQRLYGIIFGACTKRTEKSKDTFKELTEYVHDHVFNQENVYPDVLLRDYARLIIERWIHEFPDDSHFIDISKIKPPYHSVEIPKVEEQSYYYKDETHRGFNAIDFSMRLDHKDSPGIYGDFGRYRFQAALNEFNNIDIVNLYHYAMQFIRDEIGYTDDLFGTYDSMTRMYSYSRHENRKTERIGKKYQWIALYNIMARVSDTHLLKNFDNSLTTYEGPWEPHVRDFDPTLNRHFLMPSNLPTFNYPIFEEDLFLNVEPLPKDEEILEWKKRNTNLFSYLNTKLKFEDCNGNSWIALTLYENHENDKKRERNSSLEFKNGSQEIWFMAHGLFIEQERFDQIKEHLAKINYTGRHFPEGSSVYQLFNREHGWSSGCQSVFYESWKEYEIEIGNRIKQKQIVELPEIEYGDDGEITINFIKREREREVPEEIINIHVLPSYSRLSWELEYDASQDETTSFSVPCREIIETLKLEQKKYDGYYYSPDDSLVCFDGNLSGICDGLLIRQDYLEKFLAKKGLALFWTCIGEKQYFKSDYSQKWSEWSGFFYLENNEVVGSFELM